MSLLFYDYNREANAVMNYFSRVDFDCCAKAMHDALQSVSNDDTISFNLCRWELSHNDQNDVYLSHPSVTVFSSGGIEEQKDPDELVEDDTIIVDDDQYIIQIPPVKGNNNDKKEDQQRQLATEWTFSIIYSYTYQVPVLYFMVQDDKGGLIGRRQLLEILRKEHEQSIFFSINNDFPNENDTWDFVSQEEHPMTGLTSYFLHPCHSAQRMQLLNDGTKCQNEENNQSGMIWTWMSMVLSIPSSFFLRIQSLIIEQP